MSLSCSDSCGGLGSRVSLSATPVGPAQTFWRSTGLLIIIAGGTILVHLIEITVWAVGYQLGMGNARHALVLVL